MKGLRTRDYIIIGLEIIDGIIREFQDPGGIMSASYKSMYGFVPDRYRNKSFDAVLYRLNKAGLLNKEKKGEEKYYSLTEKGRVLARKKVLFNKDRKWDGKLRVIIFDIEETKRKERNFLREAIKTFGFAMWQKSVWVAAFEPDNNFYKYFETISSYCHIFTVSKEVFGDLKVFANKVWRTKNLANLYAAWISESSQFLKEGQKIEGEKKRKELIKSFLDIILADPFLPDDFLPGEWPGKEARRLFKELNTTLK